MKRLLLKWAYNYLLKNNTWNKEPVWDVNDRYWVEKQIGWLQSLKGRTPSQEAELIIRYIKQLRHPIMHDDKESSMPLFWNIAYRVSVKLVDEIILSIKLDPAGVWAKNTGRPCAESTIKFWEQVRIELEQYK
jgi:hypothetical protein